MPGVLLALLYCRGELHTIHLLLRNGAGLDRLALRVVLRLVRHIAVVRHRHITLRAASDAATDGRAACGGGVAVGVVGLLVVVRVLTAALRCGGGGGLAGRHVEMRCGVLGDSGVSDERG